MITAGAPHEWKQPGRDHPEHGDARLRSTGPFYARTKLTRPSARTQPGTKPYKASEAAKKQAASFDPLDWKRPVDNPVFTLSLWQQP